MTTKIDRRAALEVEIVEALRDMQGAVAYLRNTLDKDAFGPGADGLLDGRDVDRLSTMLRDISRVLRFGIDADPLVLAVEDRP